MTRHFRVVLWILFSLWPGLALSEELRWGFGPADGMPYAQVSDHALLGGFILHLGERIAKDLSIKVSFVETPNKRIEESLKNGRIHLICNSNPEWMVDASAYHWSPSLFEEEDALLQHRDSPRIASLADLKGKVLGTSLGFAYSMPLMEAFANKDVERKDVRDLDTRLNLLSHKRLDAIIDMRRALAYELAVRPDAPLVFSPWIVERYQLHCAYSGQLPIPAEQLDAALQRLRDSGEIESLLQGEQQRAGLQDR
ncbi:amino acid ABC transporter substrate-binding protein [Pseudomonas sp. BN414]|uniref:substrate-binding periplasmic protein n=1 Tax=Pseudomonas sp. BN414 TaxID=2567888 RepID=UPI0024555093|nr:transporter substrate-binding domain-containing protein [Pseudomonas sp. BN414]MDH4570989.1 amino acid ABC transporter substrate-binding protein [Pseudomonas sp. BN414]